MHHLSKWMPIWTATLAVAVGGLAGVGCEAVECGDGTIEQGGACVPADDNPSAAQCGPGTVLGASGKCEPEEVVMCDPDTTTAQEDPVTHVITCVGTGAQTGCSMSIPCPAPSSGHITICGQLRDSQTDDPIADAGATGTACPGTPTATGPCSLKVQFFDAVEFATSPSTAIPIPPEGGLVVDTCGRYRATDLPEAGLGFMGIGVDDATGTGDRYKLTGVALANSDALPARDFNAYATRNETDMAWTAGSGITGQSFATRGVLAMVFRHRGLGISGVTARRNSQAVPNDDYYFTDTSHTTRSMIDTAAGRSTTGNNGAVLVTDSTHQVVVFDGIGSEPPTCQWPQNNGAAVPGVVFMQLKDARTGGGALCP